MIGALPWHLLCRTWFGLWCATLLLFLADGAQAQEPQVAIVLEPVAPELVDRLRGHVAEPSWRLLLEPRPKEDRDALAAAFDTASARGARAALWVMSTKTSLKLYMLDVQSSALVERSIEWPPEERPLDRSAALETAALIVGSTLTSMLQGTPQGTRVERPEPQPEEKPQPVEPSATTLGLAWRVGYRAHAFSDALRHSGRAGIGLSFESWGIEAGAYLSQSRKLTLDSDATPGERFTLDLQEWGVSLSPTLSGELSSSVQLQVNLPITFNRLERRTTQTPNNAAATSSQALWLPSVGATLTALLWDWGWGLRPYFEAGLTWSLRRPDWRLGGASDQSLDTLPALQPLFGLGISGTVR